MNIVQELATTQREQKTKMPEEKGRYLVAGLLVVAVVCAYLPVVREGGIVWDDNHYLTENQNLKNLDGLRAIWFEPRSSPQYYPLTFTTFWMENRLWGMDPRGYHATNVVVHAISAVLLWITLHRLAVPGALLAAFIFGLHPVHVESVAWISERKNVLSGLFYLLSLRVILPWYGIWSGDRDGAPHPSRRRHRRAGYLAAMLFFICALLSKTVTASLPAAVLLIVWWKRGRISLSEIFPLAPFFATGLGFGVVTAVLEKAHVGAVGPEWSYSIPSRMLIAGRAVWFYVGKLLWPASLTFSYPRWTIDERSWLQYLFPLAALLVIVLLWRWRRRVGRGPLTAVLFFVGTLFPALGFINVYPMRYSFVADHFQYLASIGIIALFSATLSLSAGRIARKSGPFGTCRWLPLGLSTLGAAILALLGFLTWHQSLLYTDNSTLWRDTIKKNPESWMAHNNLGNLLMEQGDYANALVHLQTAVRLKPDHLKARYNIGNVLLKQGRSDEAVNWYRDAINLGYENSMVLNNLGLALAMQGKTAAAEANYRKALSYEPDNAVVLKNLARSLVATGRSEEAIPLLQSSLARGPDDHETHILLGHASSLAGDRGSAMRHYRHALRIKPESAAAREALEQLR